MAHATCSIDGCEKPVRARTWCTTHYRRWSVHGDPLIVQVRTRSTCSIDGCDRVVDGQGFCQMHYQRWKRTGNPMKVRARLPATCSIDGCARGAYAKGWCRLHHGRWQRTGDPLLVTRQRGDDVARFWAYVNKDGAVPAFAPHLGQCWEWTSTLTDDGYAKVSWKGRQRSAHRLSYELNVASIPDGFTIDHLCMVRHCVNPTHLEPVTRAENNRRAREAAASSAA